LKQRLITAVSFAAVIFILSSAAAQKGAGQRGADSRPTVPSSQVVDGDYFAFGETVEISGTINGDLYASGGQVIIDGRVNGDVLVAGGRVNLSGTVSQDVRAAGGQVTITGNVGRNLTVAGGNVEIASSAQIGGGVVAAGGSVELAAPVGSAAKIAAGTLIIANRIAGNVEAAVGTLRITSRAEIAGNVSYWSGQEASVSEGARINGKIVRNVPPGKAAAFSRRVVRLARIRVDQFCQHLDPGAALRPFSSTLSPIRHHYSQGEAMGVLGVRIYRRCRTAGRLRAAVRDHLGNTAGPDSPARVFYPALLVANLRDRPNR
jgi:cytoskeletal protein CcmA (bactofilin family)